LINKPRLLKTTRYFTPENPGYWHDIEWYGWWFFVAAGCFAFFMLVYLILRFAFGYCKGPKARISNWYSRIAFFLISNNYIK